MEPYFPDHKRLECSDNFPGPARPFLKLEIIEGYEKAWLFGAVRYTSVGSVATLDVFGFKAYVRVGHVKWLCGFEFGHDKAGE